MRRSPRLATRTALVILAAVAVLAAAAGLALRVSVTATPLHPHPQDAPSVTRSPPAPRWTGAIDRAQQELRAGLAAQNLPGVSVAVGVGGDLVWAEGFGWADVGERIPVTPETRFRIGTASRVLTSAAVGALVEQGRLSLDEEVQTWVPQFPRRQWPVTLRHLMADVAGASTDDGDEGPLFRQRCARPVEALPHVADAPLLFAPGTQLRESNYGWIVVSAAVEAAAEQPFLAFLDERIFEPLGMEDTGAESPTEENPEHMGEPGEDAPIFTFVREVFLEPMGVVEKRPRGSPTRAAFYVPRFGTDPRNGVSAMRDHNLSCYAGAMAFFSTPSDLVRFGLAMNDGTLLQPGTVQQLQTSQRLVSGQETGYGLGWNLETVTLAGAPARAVGHDGESRVGRVMTLMTFPERGIVVAVTSNVAHADTSALALRVAELFAEAGAR